MFETATHLVVSVVFIYIWLCNVLHEHNYEQEKRKGLDMIVAVIIDRKKCIYEKYLIKVNDFQHPPQAKHLVGIDVELGLKKLKESFRHTFGKDISNL